MPRKKRVTVLRPEVYVRKGFRLCTHCTAEKPDVEEFFAPERAGRCRICVFLDAGICEWGKKSLTARPQSYSEWKRKMNNEKRTQAIKDSVLRKMFRKAKVQKNPWGLDGR